MKRILVTGAFGSIGKIVLKLLLSEGKYDITALDLKTKKNLKEAKKYKNRINIVFGDIKDTTLIENLVINIDYIIHLAGVMPPFGDFYKKLGEEIEYDGTESIIKAINYYNPSCHMFYASTTSLYDSSFTGNIKEVIKETELTNYSFNKYKTEILLKKKLKCYTIFRIPLVLSNVNKETFVYNIKKNSIVEVTTDYDVAYAFVKGIIHSKDINKKIYDVGMGEKSRLYYREILINILKYNGISFKYLVGRIFFDKNYYSPVLSDSDELDNIIHYRFDTFKNYYQRLSYNGKNRYIQKILAKPIIFILKKGMKK